MQPLSVVKNAGFKQLMYTAEPRFKVPSRPYFTNTVIPAMYTRKMKTEKVLPFAQYCSVTTQPNIVQEAILASLFTVLPLRGNLQATVYQQRNYQNIRLLISAQQFKKC